jgi:hypothetical protein
MATVSQIITDIDGLSQADFVTFGKELGTALIDRATYETADYIVWMENFYEGFADATKDIFENTTDNVVTMALAGWHKLCEAYAEGSDIVEAKIALLRSFFSVDVFYQFIDDAINDVQDYFDAMDPVPYRDKIRVMSAITTATAFADKASQYMSNILGYIRRSF